MSTFKRTARIVGATTWQAAVIYTCWVGMRARCHCKTNKGYRYYGGRGITICDEWSDYVAFREWALNNGYKKGLTIDRIDNDGNYEPSNCRWITQAEQNRNNSQIKILTINGVTRTLQAWAKLYDIRPRTVRFRLSQLGWSARHAVFLPRGTLLGGSSTEKNREKWIQANVIDKGQNP